MSRLRNACFTWNNYPENYLDKLDGLPKFSYRVLGHEVGESGTKHIQGYIEFEKQARFDSLRKKIPEIHWESRAGTSTQAAQYCKKDGVFAEFGVLSTPGKRTDLDQVRDTLKEGNLRDVVSTARSMQSVRFAEVYLKYNEVKRNFKPTVYWLYGETGVGKTRRALAHAIENGTPEDQVHIQIENSKWWDGYDKHSVVIIDDIRQEFCSFVRILNLLDRYACRVETKGGTRQLLATSMYVTSPWHPEQIWSTYENKDQLIRRIDVLLEVKSMQEVNTIKGTWLEPRMLPSVAPEESPRSLQLPRSISVESFLK